MNRHFIASEADRFSRLILLPQLAQLTTAQRESFDSRVVERFEPGLHVMKPWTVHEILHRLELNDLVYLSEELTK